jgi:hypothetical protein
VLEKVGPIETEESLSLFDTHAFCGKARQAGFTLAVCRDLYIHHFGTRTYAHGAPVGSPAPYPSGGTRP